MFAAIGGKNLVVPMVHYQYTNVILVKERNKIVWQWSFVYFIDSPCAEILVGPVNGSITHIMKYCYVVCLHMQPIIGSIVISIWLLYLDMIKVQLLHAHVYKSFLSSPTVLSLYWLPLTHQGHICYPVTLLQHQGEHANEEKEREFTIMCAHVH